MNDSLRQLWRPETPYVIGTVLVLVVLRGRDVQFRDGEAREFQLSALCCWDVFSDRWSH